MTCPDIPLWFILLAVFGAVCAVSFPIYWLLRFAGLFATRDEVTHVGQINRRLFR